jgi:hypothetical protein
LRQKLRRHRVWHSSAPPTCTSENTGGAAEQAAGSGTSRTAPAVTGLTEVRRITAIDTITKNVSTIRILVFIGTSLFISEFGIQILKDRCAERFLRDPD